MESTDRELLELAAKAAGVKGRVMEYTASISIMLDGGDPDEPSWWNPLTDDGDALRLAVKLDMQVTLYLHDGVTNAYGQGHVVDEPHSNDPVAATRRAIVRAAAEIGKNMQGENQ